MKTMVKQNTKNQSISINQKNHSADNNGNGLRSGWETKNFEDVCELVGGSQPAKDNFIYEPKDGYIRLIQVRDYRTDKYATYIPKETARRFCTVDDIMIGRYGPPIFGIFKGIEGAYNVALMKAVVNKKICDPNYFYWFLQTENLRAFVEKSSKRAAGQDGVRKELLAKYPVFVPPIFEQKRIVEILDKAFAAIDKAKANVEKNLQNAKELFESYLQNIFVSRGEDWEEKKLSELSERVSVGHVGSTSQFYCDKTVGVPFLRSQNVRSGNLDLKGVQYITKDFHRRLKKSQLKLGDLLFVRVGANRGDCCVVKKDMGELNCANIVFARLKEGNVDFIDKFCQSKIGREQLLGMSVGAAQGVINTKSVAELIILYPKLSEQIAILEKINSISNETKKLEIIYHQKLNDLEELKKSILQKAFTGRFIFEQITELI